MLSLILSIISIVLSITLFIVSHYRQLYRLGIATGKVYYSTEVSQTGQEKQIMFIELNIINESQTPAVITGLTITDRKFQKYSSDDGEIIDKTIQIKNDMGKKHEVFDEYTKTLPIVIAPYSSFKGTFAFYQMWLFRQDHFLELETTKRFLEIPFNPIPDHYIHIEERHDRNRILKYYWKQNPLRTFQNKLLLVFTKKFWRKIYFKTKNLILKIFSYFKRYYNKN